MTKNDTNIFNKPVFPISSGGIIINIECKAWARNIRHTNDRHERLGSVHFELLID